MPRRRSPGPPVVEITAENRAALLAAAREWQPRRPADAVDRWRRYVAKHWREIDLDDEAALLIATSGPFTILSAQPALREFLAALRAISFPGGDMVRQALAREEGRRPAFWLDTFLPEVDAVRARFAWVHTVAGILVRSAEDAEVPSFATGRAEAADRLRRFLTDRHPAATTPPWKIVAAFLWRAGSWHVDPGDEDSIRGLIADWARWQKRTSR